MSSFIVVTLNGPGELVGWVEPFLRQLASVRPSASVVVVLWPCVFASGAEPEAARALPLVREVVPATVSLRLLTRRRPGWKAEALVHFGGEPALSLALAARLGCTAIAYAEAPFPAAALFSRVHLTSAPGGRLARNTSVAGSLVADRARRLRAQHPAETGARPVIGLLPGSREPHVKHTLPFLLEAASVAAQSLDAGFFLALSPFVSLDTLGRLAADERGRLVPGVSGVLETGEGGPFLRCASGLVVRVAPGAEVLCRASLLTMLPGTSTAEAAALGVPMIVLVPSHSAELVPWPGPVGLLSLVPGFGNALKRRLVTHIARSRRFFAHPNLAAGRELVPELRGAVTPRELAAEIVRRASDRVWLRETSTALLSLLGPPGAAARLVESLDVKPVYGGAPERALG